MDAIEKYIEEMSSPQDELLRELDRQTHLRTVHPHMACDAAQGRLLEMIVRMLRPQSILEIGTFTGYSTLCLAAGLDDGGRLDTIDVNDELHYMAASFFARSPHGARITQHTGSALRIMPALGRVYDLVYIDGGKREYPDYFRIVMGDAGTPALVKSGSFILADNVLWYGEVAKEAASKPLDTRRIDEFNRMVREDARVENTILSLRDGINIIRVK